MVNGHGKNPANEAKIIQVSLVAESRVGVDLECVIVTGRERMNNCEKCSHDVSSPVVNTQIEKCASPCCILKESIVWIEHFMREKKEPFPVRSE